MKKVKYLVIGAGITGLSFAKSLKSDDYMIIERDNRIGGLCKTFYENGFVWDYAGHFFHFHTKKIKDFFEKKIDKSELKICKKKTKIYYKNNWIDYPFQKNIHQLEKEEFIECLLDVYMKKEKKNYGDFQDMLYGKFGKGITEKFLKPYNEKLYACLLSSLDVDAMGRFFPYANFEEIMEHIKNGITNSYNDIFQYPIQGAQKFVDILEKEIDSSKVLLNSDLKKVDYKRKIAVVNSEEIQYEFLINTIPLKYFSELLYKKIEDTPLMSGNKVLVFNLGFNKKTNIKDLHWIYFPEKEINFYRVGFYDNILDEKLGSMYVEIGFSEKENIDIDKELEKVILNLKKCKIIDEETEIISKMHLIIELGYVHISKIEEIQKYKKKLKEYNTLLMRNYGGDYLEGGRMAPI
ncbi:NAD(P)/FAD-dependent oxidoreductase [Fusobacterium perfoetens]|uniref:protoporphyrinogen/coproporphyrinogen oxidase n=1 Tax=Fusobacterium perfoetens TaxID=852 RepID=UPI0026EBFCE7|nr:NAD(P)-binding protein [Fusobacterium perfoetens]